MPNKNVLITAYVAGNLGDDLFIMILCNRYPKTTFFLFCPPEYRLFYKDIDNLILFNEREIDKDKLVQKIDFQVMIGGSLFMQPKDDKMITDKFYSTISCRLSSHIPFFIIGANFGPYFNIQHFTLYKSWFSQLTDICFRDMQSFKLFDSLGNVRWSSDVVFNLALPHISKTKTVIISCIYQDNRIGLSDYCVNDYYVFLATISKEYVKRGYHIIFQSFCSHQQDEKAAEEICQLIEFPYRKRVDIFKYNGNITLFLKTFLQAEYVIGTRFHSIIISWLAKIPVYPIIYNTKTQNVINDYGFKGAFSDINNLKSWSFENIDYNRTCGYTFDCRQLIEVAPKQFYGLDILLNRKE